MTTLDIEFTRTTTYKFQIDANEEEAEHFLQLNGTSTIIDGSKLGGAANDLAGFATAADVYDLDNELQDIVVEEVK